MPIQSMQLYMFRFTLPDGVHIAAHRDMPSVTPEMKEAVMDRIRMWASQNPDAQVDFNSLKAVKSLDEIADAAKQLQAENPERRLATDLGLDTPNRIMTNPDLARANAPTPDA